MRPIIIAILLVCCSLVPRAQALKGVWEGEFTDNGNREPIFLDFTLGSDSSYVVFSYSAGLTQLFHTRNGIGSITDSAIICSVFYNFLPPDSVYLEELAVVSPPYAKHECLQKMFLRIAVKGSVYTMTGRWESDTDSCNASGEIRFIKRNDFELKNNTGRKPFPGFNKRNISTGRLSEADYTKLKELLAAFSSAALTDSIYIKYDFNHENCWDMLDRMSDDYISSVVLSYQTNIQRQLNKRRYISVFQLREKGNDINKYKLWNGMIQVDSSREVFRLFFHKKPPCGNSIFIGPDRRYVIFRSDSHFLLLTYPADKLAEILDN